MDNGGKFKAEFSKLCKNIGLKRKESNSWNPQLNSILERIQQVFGDKLRLFDLDNININTGENDPFEKYITAVAYAICVHTIRLMDTQQDNWCMDGTCYYQWKAKLIGIK